MTTNGPLDPYAFSACLLDTLLGGKALKITHSMTQCSMLKHVFPCHRKEYCSEARSS